MRERTIKVTEADDELMNAIVRKYRHELYMEYKKAESVSDVQYIDSKISSLERICSKYGLEL